MQRQAALWIPLPAPQSLIDQLTAIHEEHGRCVEEGYLRGVHEANDRFHLTLFGACGNQQLVKTIELYMRLSLPVRANSMADAESLKISHEHHRLMIEMLKGRDNWVLAQLCVDHLQPSKHRYLGSRSARVNAVHQSSARSSDTPCRGSVVREGDRRRSSRGDRACPRSAPACSRLRGAGSRRLSTSCGEPIAFQTAKALE